MKQTLPQGENLPPAAHPQISKTAPPDLSEGSLTAQDTASFTLDYFAPDADLAPYISTFYAAHIHATIFDEYERADRPQFRFTSAPNGSYIFGKTARYPVCRANIIGPTSGKVRAVQHGPTAIFGFGLLPAGWAALVGSEAARLTDQSIDAQIMFGPWIAEVATAIEQAADDQQRLVMGNALARELLAHAENAPMWFIKMVDQWLISSPSPKIPDLVATVKMSLRSIERMTKIYYGLPPRLLARKYRALRAANLLARGESLESANLADAFYDQSHLIREIKHFAGPTPRQLQHPSPYTLATVRGRKSLSKKLLPIVSDT